MCKCWTSAASITPVLPRDARTFSAEGLESRRLSSEKALAAALLLAIGCVSEPDYTGRACNADAPCPSPYFCFDNACALESADAGSSDRGVTPDLGAPSDLGVPPDLGTPPDPVVEVLLAPRVLEVVAGRGFSFSAMGRTASGGRRDITQQAQWSLQDLNIARLEGPGTGRGLAQGVTVITASLEGVQASAALTVLPPVLVTVSARNKHSLALRSDGRVWAWGWNEEGQVGEAPFEMVRAPELVPLDAVTMIAAGGVMSVAVREDGTVWSWGRNMRGELGVGLTSAEPIPVPTQVVSYDGAGALDDVVDVVAGFNFALVRHSDGTLSTWGEGSSGQLGQGNSRLQSTPVSVPDVQDVLQIAAGAFHALALTRDGKVWAWGWNEYGQLGNGTVLNDGPSPARVQMQGGTDLQGVQAISAGWGHSTALLGSGEVLSWGWNGAGQLGDGTVFDRPFPGPVLGPSGVGTLSNIRDISAGFSFNLARRMDDRLFAWGFNQFGQLGDGLVESRSTPDLVLSSPGGPPFLDLAAFQGGGDHVVALRSDGQLWAWGRNEHGEVTSTDPASVTSPARVTLP